MLPQSPEGASGNKESNFVSSSFTHRCGYVFGAADERGRDRFCNAPAMVGSSYCARHRARCTADPQSPKGRAIAVALRWHAEHAPGPPSQCTHLDAAILPEPMLPEEPRDLLALLDYPPPVAMPDSE